MLAGEIQLKYWRKDSPKLQSLIVVIVIMIVIKCK